VTTSDLSRRFLMMRVEFFHRVGPASRAALMHFAVCVAIAAIIAALTFGIWFPWPYRELTGGRSLFLLIIAVDVVCGPLLTLILFSPLKSKHELCVDFGVILLIQVAALMYGLHALALARPVYVVFEIDRLRVVVANEINPQELRSASAEFKKLPWDGPKLISTRESRDSDELLESVNLSLAGIEPSLRPSRWQEYSKDISRLLRRAKPISDLLEKHPDQKAEIDALIQRAKVHERDLAWLPLTSSRNLGWVALLGKNDGMPRGFIELDGF